MVAGFEFGEKDGSFLCGASSAHETAALERLELADVRSCVAEGQQVGGRERFGVALVEIQSVNQRRAFQHDSHTGVAMSVNAAFVGFGVAKPAFQIEIILRQASHIATGKQAPFKAQQDFRHLLSHGISAGLTDAMQFVEAGTARLAVALCRIESFGNGTHDFDMLANHGQFVSHAIETTIDATRQTFQSLFRSAPFFVARQRSTDSCTDCNASTMRRPGGCSGPPWSSFKIPFTAVQ